MPEKRKNAPSEPGNGSPYTKRSRPSPAQASFYADADGDSNDEEQERSSSRFTPAYERPRNNPFYGQKSAFPGLDDPNLADELFYGPAEDGLEYLRMVRSEANTLPSLFVAPKTTTSQVPISEEVTQDGEGGGDEKPQKEEPEPEPEPRGYYYDGVYVARSAPAPTNAPSGTSGQEVEDKEEDVQSSYYNLLRHRFRLLRSTLRCSPPASAIAALDDSHPISLPYSVKPARSEWRRLLLTTDPLMVQLACMDVDSVFGVLKLVGHLLSENLKSGDATRIRRIGAWAWGLLGRCRDVGELTSEEVADLRELGKRAVKILSKLKEEKRAKSVNNDIDPRHHSQLRDGSQQEKKEGDSGMDEDGEVVETGVEAGAEADAGTGIVSEGVEGNNVPVEVDQQPSVETPTIADKSEEVTTQGSREPSLPPSEPVGSEPGEDADANLEAAKTRLQAQLLQSTATEDELPPEKEESSSIQKEQDEDVEDGEVEPELDPDEPAKQTHAMLDMIITVVGEFYGQRDLLQAREIWE